MKKTLIATAHMFLFVFIFFTSQTNIPAQISRTGQVQRTTSNLTIGQQAEQQARAFWNARINTRCGEDSFTLDGGYIHQFRNMRIDVRSRQLSTADRLNGIEFLGYTSVKVGQARTYSRSTGWGKWSDGFTGAMRAIGLDASLRKENGRWSVRPDSISQASVLKSVNCNDASNPEAYFRQIARAAYSKEMQKVISDAPNWGIYASESPKVPASMINSMYQFKQRGELRQVSFTPKGGWIVNRYGAIYSSREGLPEEFVAKVREISYGISNVAFTPTGGWLIVYDKGGDQSQFWNSNNIPQGIIDQLLTLKSLARDKKAIPYKDRVRSVAFTPEGGWAMIWGKNGYRFENVPDEAADALKDLSRRGMSINSIAFTKNGGFLIIYGGRDSRVIYNNLPPDILDLLHRLRSDGKKIYQVTFAPDGRWIVEGKGSHHLS